MIKSKKKSLFLIVTALLVAVVACCLPFIKLNQSHVVMADEITSSTFTTSSQTLVVGRFNGTNSFNEYASRNLFFSFSLTYSSGVYTIKPNLRYYIYVDEDNAEDFFLSTLNFYASGNSWSNSGVTLPVNTILQCGFKEVSGYNLTNSYRFNLRVSDSFNVNDVVRCWNGADDSENQVWWEYYDSVGNSFSITFFGVPNDICTRYTDRVLYLTDDADFTSQSYQSGYAAGYNAGVDDGYSSGNTTGYNAGYTAGDSAGYTRGVLESNDYSFIGLIGATVDAPIKALTGLLNFEILGVNLSAFVYGLFSITLVIIVIKYIKR